MTEIWLTQNEVSNIENCSKMTFWRRFKAGWYKKYRYTKISNGNNGRGGKTLQVALSELTPAAQEKYLREVYQIDKHPAADLAEQFQIRVPPEKLSDPRVATKIRMLAECLAVPEKTRGRGRHIAAIAESYGFNVGTAYRLIKKVKKGKPLFRARQESGAAQFDDLGVTLRAWDKASGRMAIEAIMGNKRNKVELLALYNKVCAQANGKGLRIGSYESFCWLARKISSSGPAVLTYRDKGIQGLRQDVAPAIRRDPTAYRPMECLVGDQHKADYYAFDSNGNVATLELFCWMDFRTQLVWSAVSLKHYNRYTVGQALLNAVRWGLPSIVYTDWGKPEESNYINLLIEQITGLGVQVEGVGRVRATPRHPQAKPIEGWFGRFDRNMKNDEVPGYMKRLKDPRENELQQKEIQRQIKARELLSVPDLVERITGLIDEWNNHKFKNRGQDNGKSPIFIYKKETAQYPVTTLAEDVLEYIFLPIRIVKRVKNSSFSFKHDWWGKRFYYNRALADFTGREVQVRYDPFDPSAVWVFADKKLVCQAEEWGMINPKMRDEVADRMAEQKTLIRQITETYKAYQPPRKAVRRINPHEREAKELKTVRVLRTQLEQEEELAAAAGGQTTDDRRQSPTRQSRYGDGATTDAFREMYSIERRPRPRLVEPADRPFMRLSIDDPILEDD